jgi:hypothetical protein
VRYKVADIAPGVQQAVGETPYDLGGGKQVEDFVVVQRETDDVSFVLHILSGVAGQIGVATGLELVKSTAQLDEVAPVVLGNTGTPVHQAVVRVPEVDGATRITGFDSENVVILRADAIETIALPI